MDEIKPHPNQGTGGTETQNLELDNNDLQQNLLDKGDDEETPLKSDWKYQISLDS